jgi:uncharacterized DUF497 family protein
MEFEWDEDKAVQYLRKHKVEFEEASTVFGDPQSRMMRVARTSVPDA